MGPNVQPSYRDKICLQGVGHVSADLKFNFTFKHPLLIPKPEQQIIIKKNKTIVKKKEVPIATVKLPKAIAARMEKLKNISEDYRKISFYFDTNDKPLMLQAPISNLGTLQILIRVWKEE